MNNKAQIRKTHTPCDTPNAAAMPKLAAREIDYLRHYS
jgi:hypothetical protein